MVVVVVEVSLTLTAPLLRGGCSGDESVTLEYREVRWAEAGENAGWRASAAAEGSSEVHMLSGLDPEEAYEARVIAHNAKGTSAPGPPSQPLLIANTAEDGLPLDAAAPRAVAVGAAAVVVTWAPPQQAAAAAVVVVEEQRQSCRPGRDGRYSCNGTAAVPPWLRNG